MSNQWLQELKPGDEVVVYFGYPIDVAKVEKVTKRHVVIGDGRYSRKTGRDFYSPLYIAKVTDDAINFIECQAVRQQIRSAMEKLNIGHNNKAALQKALDALREAVG